MALQPLGYLTWLYPSSRADSLSVQPLLQLYPAPLLPTPSPLPLTSIFCPTQQIELHATSSPWGRALALREANGSLLNQGGHCWDSLPILVYPAPPFWLIPSATAVKSPLRPQACWSRKPSVGLTPPMAEEALRLGASCPIPVPLVPQLSS